MRNTNCIVEMYVDQKKGNDLHLGTCDDYNSNYGPLKSIKEVLKRVRELRMLNYMQPITIKMMGDEYIIDECIEIDKGISYVTFESYRNNKFSFRGAKKIENFEEVTFNGIKCLKAKVGEEFIPTDLFVSGKRLDVTRYPEEGFLSPLDTESKTPSPWDTSTWFVAKKEDYPAFDDFENSTVNFNHYWVDEHTPIDSFDRESGRVDMEYVTGMSIFSGDVSKIKYDRDGNAEHGRMDYYIENIKTMLKKPNQWYFDKKERTVYYILESFDKAEAYIPTTAQLFKIKGDCINFRNLVFEYTASNCEKHYNKKLEKYVAACIQAMCIAEGAICFDNSKSSSIKNCIMENIGQYCIQIGEGCRNITISENTMKDSGVGGIIIRGSNSEEEVEKHTYGNTFEDNIITNYGVLYNSGIGILLMNSYENRIRHNEISYGYYTGLSVGWVWGYNHSNTFSNIIEKNYIHHIGQKILSDIGGIYLLGKQPGTIVRNNLIHDIFCKQYGGNGIYSDQGTGYITFENNIVYNVETASYQQHFGCMNVVKNNIFAAGDHGTILHWRQGAYIGSVIKNNILMPQGKCVYGRSTEDVLTACFISDDNIIYEESGEDAVYFVQDGVKKYKEDVIREHDLDENSIELNPEFKDIKNFDFTLDENSPVYKTEFSKIDLSDVGPRKR